MGKLLIFLGFAVMFLAGRGTRSHRRGYDEHPIRYRRSPRLRKVSRRPYNVTAPNPQRRTGPKGTFYSPKVNSAPKASHRNSTKSGSGKGGFYGGGASRGGGAGRK